MDLDGLTRKELQSLCKKHGVPANLTNLEMVNRLTKFLKVKENRIVEEGSEKNSEEEDDAPKKKSKKVRFSPAVETREYEVSAHEKPLTRRTRGDTLVNSALKDSEEESSGALVAGKKRGRGNVTKRTGNRVTRSQAIIIDEEVQLSCSVIEKKNETVKGRKGLTRKKIDGDRVEGEATKGGVRRSTRSTANLTVSEEVQLSCSVIEKKNETLKGRKALTRKKIDGDPVEGEATKGVRRSTRSTAVLTDSEAVQVGVVGRITRKRSRNEDLEVVNAVEVKASEKASLPTACLPRSRRKTTVFNSTVFASHESGEGEAVRKGKQSNETVSGMGVYVTDEPWRSTRNDSRQILQAASNEIVGKVGQPPRSRRKTLLNSAVASDESAAAEAVGKVHESNENVLIEGDYVTDERQRSTRNDSTQRLLAASSEIVGKVGQPRRSSRKTMLASAVASDQPAAAEVGEVQKTNENVSREGDYVTDAPGRSKRGASRQLLEAASDETNGVDENEKVENTPRRSARFAFKDDLIGSSASKSDEKQQKNISTASVSRKETTQRKVSGKTQSARHAFKNDIIGSSASVGKKQQSISKVPVMVNEIMPTNSSPPIEDTGLTVSEDTGERNLVLNSSNALGSSQRIGEPKTKSRRKRRSSSVDVSTPYSDTGLKIDGVTNLEEIMESAQPKVASTSIEEEASKVAAESMDVATSQTDIIGAEMDSAQNSKVREPEPLNLVTASPGKEASEVAGETVIDLGNIILMGDRGNGTSDVIIEGSIDDQSGESFYFSGLEKVPAREEIISGKDEGYGSDDISNPSAEVDRISIEDSEACLEKTEQDNTKREVEDKFVPDDGRSVPAVSAATVTRSSTEDVCQETDTVNDCSTENEVFVQNDNVNVFERTKQDKEKDEIEDSLVSDDGRSVPAVCAAIVTRSSTEDVCQETDTVSDCSTEIKVFVQEDVAAGFERIEQDNTKGEIGDKLVPDVVRSVPAVSAVIVTGSSTEDVCQETDTVNDGSTEIEIFLQGNDVSGFERTEQDNTKEEIEDKLVPDDGRSLPAVSAAIVVRSSTEDICQETDTINDCSTEIEMFVQEDGVRGFERTEQDDTTNRNEHGGVSHNRQASLTFSAEIVEEEIADAHHSSIAGTSPHSVCSIRKVNDEHPQASSLKLSICGGKLSVEDSEQHQDETETTTSDKDLKEVSDLILEESLPGFDPGKLEDRKVGNAAIVRSTNDEILCQKNSGDCMVGERGSSFNNSSGRPFSPEASSVTRVLDLASEKFHNYKETAVSRNCSVDAVMDVPAIEYCNPVMDIVGNQSMGGKLVVEQHEMEVKDSVCSGVAELDEYGSQMMDGKVNSQMAIKETISDMVMKELLNSEQCDLTTREGITQGVGVAKILDHGVSEEVAACLCQSTQQSENSELKDVELNAESSKSIKGIDRMEEKETKFKDSTSKVDFSMEFIGDYLNDDNAPEVHDGNVYDGIFEKEKADDNETGMMADDTHQTQCEEGVKISDVILDHMEVLLNSGDADLVAASEAASTVVVGRGKTSNEVKDAEAVELDNLKKRYALEADTSDFVYVKAADGEEEVGKTEGNLESKDSNQDAGKASNGILFSSHEDACLKSQDETAFFTNWEVNLMYRDGEHGTVESDEESLEDNSMSKDSVQVIERQTDNENIGQVTEAQVGKVLPLVRDELIFDDDLDGTYVINQEFIHFHNYEDKKLENTSFSTHGGDLAEAAIFGGKQKDASDKCTEKSASESLKEAEEISNPFGLGVSETGGYAKDKDAYTTTAAKIHIQEELVDEGPVLSVFPDEASHEMERAELQKTVSGCSQMEGNMHIEVLLSVESYRSKPEIDAGSSSLQQNAKASYEEFEEQLMEDDEAVIGENDGIQNASEDPNDPTDSSSLGKDGRDCQEVEREQLVHQYPVNQAASMEAEFDTSDAVTPFQRVLEVDGGTTGVGAFPYQESAESGGLELNLSFGEGEEYKVEKIGAQTSQAKLIRGDTEESHENAISIEQTAPQVAEDQEVFEEKDISMEDVEVNAFPEAAPEQTLKFDPSNLKQVNCANLIVEGVGEAKELMEDMPEKEETKVDQSLAFTNPSVDYLSDITVGDDQSCLLKMQSPNVEQLTCSGIKRKTGRIGLIQRTPEKVIDSDAMKENAPSTKVGNVTAPKTLSRRRPLEDLRNY